MPPYVVVSHEIWETMLKHPIYRSVSCRFAVFVKLPNGSVRVKIANSAQRITMQELHALVEQFKHNPEMFHTPPGSLPTIVGQRFVVCSKLGSSEELVQCEQHGMVTQVSTSKATILAVLNDDRDTLMQTVTFMAHHFKTNDL